MKKRSTTTVANIQQEIQRTLKQLRKKHGLNQAAMAQPLGVTWQQYQKYEHGTNRISAARYLFLCAWLEGKTADDSAINTVESNQA